MSSQRPSSLYADLLGPAWHELPSCVQALHSGLGTSALRGRMQIRHGHHRAARMLARLLRLPAESPAVELSLTVEQRGQAERWVRRFGDAIIATTQRSGLEQLLCERFGVMEFTFKLEVVDGCLLFRQRQTALRLAGCSLRLPRWLAPEIIAAEKRSGSGDTVEVSVQVILPGFGLLLAYSGVVYGWVGGRA